MLQKIVEPVRVRYQYERRLEIPAGKRLKVETSPQGEELIDEEVPAGKYWLTQVEVSIEEFDV